MKNLILTLFLLIVLSCAANAGTYTMTVTTANFGTLVASANWVNWATNVSSANWVVRATNVSSANWVAWATNVSSANWVARATLVSSANWVARSDSALYLQSTPNTLVTNNYYLAVSINNTLKAQNVSVNNIDILGDITYRNTYWDDMLIDFVRATKLGVTDPDWAAWAGTALYTYHFDDTRDEELSFTIQMSHRYKTGTTVNVHVHYSPDTTNTGNIVWGIDYTVVTINGTFPTTLTTITGNCTIATASQYKHLLCDIGTIPAQGTVGGSAPSWIIMGKVYRKGSAPQDTLAGDVTGLDVDLHYEVDSPGSREIITK